MQETKETRVRSLGWEDTLEEEMAAHSSFPAWEIPWTEKLDGLQSGVAESQTQLSTHRDEHTQSGDFPGGVQWLKFCPSTAAGCGLKYLVGKRRSCMPLHVAK